MTRRHRFAVIAAAVLASLGGSAVAANASLPGAPEVSTVSGGENTHGDWVCVHVETVMVTYCQGDPLPERLPLPDRPNL